jgi:hypothetical protein
MIWSAKIICQGANMGMGVWHHWDIEPSMIGFQSYFVMEATPLYLWLKAKGL